MGSMMQRIGHYRREGMMPNEDIIEWRDDAEGRTI